MVEKAVQLRIDGEVKKIGGGVNKKKLVRSHRKMGKKVTEKSSRKSIQTSVKKKKKNSRKVVLQIIEKMKKLVKR